MRKRVTAALAVGIAMLAVAAPAAPGAVVSERQEQCTGTAVWDVYFWVLNDIDAYVSYRNVTCNSQSAWVNLAGLVGSYQVEPGNVISPDRTWSGTSSFKLRGTVGGPYYAGTLTANPGSIAGPGASGSGVFAIENFIPGSILNAEIAYTTPNGALKEVHQGATRNSDRDWETNVVWTSAGATATP